MTSLWLPWGWMTHEEINNSIKKKSPQEVNRKEKLSLIVMHTHTRTHTLREANQSHIVSKQNDDNNNKQLLHQIWFEAQKNRAKKRGTSAKGTPGGQDKIKFIQITVTRR